MGRVIAAALLTKAATAFAGRAGSDVALTAWTRNLVNGMSNLKFAAWVDARGFPRIVPVIQAQCCPGDRIIFSTAAFHRELAEIPAGAPLTVFGMTLKMEDVLLRGTFRGVRRVGPFACGLLDADWVYNPMPPVPGVIYPAAELAAVSE